MSLYVLISGFGSPHWEHKVEILEQNLEKICSYSWTKLKIRLCQYVPPEIHLLPMALLAKYPIEVVYEKGIVGEFIKKYANPADLTDYDYVMLLLDDVEIKKIDFEKVLQYQKDLHLDIVSLTMTPDSKYQYSYMLQDTVNQAQVKVTTVCEYFCMFFPQTSYAKYYYHITLDNPWMWGLDLVLHKHLGLTIGLLNEFPMKHWYKSESYALRPDADPAAGFHRCIERYGETPLQLSEQRAVRYVVYYPTR